MENEAPVVITFNEIEYRAEDLNEAQTDIAAKLNITGRQLSQLKEAYETYLVLNDYKNIMIKAFEATVEDGNEEISEDNS
jgi:hypothetical protein